MNISSINFIGIHGPLQSGKTTMANKLKEIIEVNGHTAVILPFAAPLKKFATELGWNGKKDEKGRRLLQLLGTDCGRDCIDQNIWVNKWEDAAESVACFERHPLWIIADDLRFPNELHAIKSNMGRSIKIVGRGVPGEHASEHELPTDAFDFVIDNSHSVEEYHSRIEGLYELLAAKASVRIPVDK